jgi:hypothetical protein
MEALLPSLNFIYSGEGSWTLQGRDCQRGSSVPKFTRDRRNKGLEVIPQKFFRFSIPPGYDFRHFLKRICLKIAVILGFIRNNVISFLFPS